MTVMDFDVLGFFWGILSVLIDPIVSWLIGFLPDGDPQVFAIIDAVGSVGYESTFNVFYFCEWRAVLVCFGVLVTITLIVYVMKLVIAGLRLGGEAVEAIPVIE